MKTRRRCVPESFFRSLVDPFARDVVEIALRVTNTRQDAARLLGISTRTLNRVLAKAPSRSTTNGQTDIERGGSR